jgi:hypothetical protein
MTWMSQLRRAGFVVVSLAALALGCGGGGRGHGGDGGDDSRESCEAPSTPAPTCQTLSDRVSYPCPDPQDPSSCAPGTITNCRDTATLAVCQQGTWRCPPGSVRRELCACPDAPPALGCVCAEGGWVCPDGGAGNSSDSGSSPGDAR